MVYQRRMSETISCSHRQAMLIWEQAGSAAAQHATFHVIGRSYSFSGITDLHRALVDILEEIEAYKTDMAAGFIDEHGVQTEAGRIHQLEMHSTPLRELDPPGAPNELRYCGACNKRTDHMVRYECFPCVSHHHMQHPSSQMTDSGPRDLD